MGEWLRHACTSQSEGGRTFTEIICRPALLGEVLSNLLLFGLV